MVAEGSISSPEEMPAALLQFMLATLAPVPPAVEPLVRTASGLADIPGFLRAQAAQVLF